MAFLADSLVVGGAERVLQAILEDLPAHGISPRLGCLRAAGPVGEELRASGLRVEEGLAPSRKDPANFFRIQKWLQRERPAAVYLLDHSNVLFWGRLAATSLRIPNVVAVHRTGRADGQPSLSGLDRMLMPLSSAVIAVSQGHAAYLAESEGIAADRLRIIFNGIHAPNFGEPLQGQARKRRRVELGLPALGPLFLHVAALRPEKNHRGLLEALAMLPAKARPTVAFVGGGLEENALREEALRLGLQRSVYWLGWRQDVPELLSVADLLLLPSHPRVETFPVSVLEAMGASVPALATRVGSLDEMIEDGITGWLIAPEAPVALAQALAELAASATLLAQAGRAARHKVEAEFPRTRMVQATADLLKEVSSA